MKKLILSSILIISTILSYSQSRETSKFIDIKKEEAAIKRVIESETRHFLKRDFKEQRRSLLQDETLIGLGAWKDRYLHIIGWKEMKSFFEEFYQKYPEPDNLQLEFSNYQIKVFPKSAWAFYHQKTLDNNGKIISKHLSGRFLEKVEGEWKISFITFADVTSYGED